VERSTTELTGRLAEYTRLAEQAKAMRDNIDEIRGTGYSADDLVTAVVDGRGTLVELDLDPRIYRDRNATELATKIVAAVHEATEDAERKLVELVEKLLPPNQRGSDVDPMFDPAEHLLSEASAAEGGK
jgi:DNA-binding protein YbaB